MTDSANPTNDCGESQESIDKKILNEFKKYEKGFDGKSKPVYWNHCGEKTTLKKIHDDANTGDNSVAVIAVTREQYNICLLYTSPSPRDRTRSRMPSSA